MVYTTKNLEETQKIATDFTKTLVNSASSAVIIGLSGDLGSAKTTFVKYMAEALGIKETVTSPTFIIEKIYKLQDNLYFDHLIHIDAYRMENGRELVTLGFDDIAKNPRNLILIEWPERVADVLPLMTQTIRFKFIDENTREIQI